MLGLADCSPLWTKADCRGIEDDVDCEDDFEREEMGRDDIADVGREASLKIYIWKVESMEDRVVGCEGDGGREFMMYPIEAVLLKKEPDHEDALLLDDIVGGRLGPFEWEDSATGKMGALHNAHEILSLLLCTPATVVEDVYDIDSAKSEAADIGSIVNCPE